MFSCFSKTHEERFSALVAARTNDQETSGDDLPLAAAFSALHACRAEIVHELQSAEAPDARERLRSLYAGLSILVDFLDRRRSDNGRHLENSFITSETVPAERG